MNHPYRVQTPTLQVARRRPLWPGILLVCLGPVLTVAIGLGAALSGAFAVADGSRLVENGGTVDLTADDHRVVFVPRDASGTSCSVSGPDGPVAGSADTGSGGTRVRQQDYVPVTSFTAATDGTFAVSCDGLAGTEVLVSPPVSVGALFGRAAAVGGIGGFVVTAAGVVLLVRRGRATTSPGTPPGTSPGVRTAGRG